MCDSFIIHSIYYMNHKTLNRSLVRNKINRNTLYYIEMDSSTQNIAPVVYERSIKFISNGAMYSKVNGKILEGLTCIRLQVDALLLFRADNHVLIFYIIWIWNWFKRCILLFSILSIFFCLRNDCRKAIINELMPFLCLLTN